MTDSADTHITENSQAQEIQQTQETNQLHMYCIFCQTQKTEQVAQLIEMIHKDQGGVRCISPKIIQRSWTKGKEELRVHNYLPGYLFLYTERPILQFTELRRISGVIRILGRREDSFELTGSDYAFAQMLYDMDGTIGIMKTVQVGDLVKLDQSIYKGFSGDVIKVDRRKCRAKIRFEFDRNIQNVWVGYEMLQPADKKEEKKEEK